VIERVRIWWEAQRTRGNYGEFVQAILRLVIGFLLGSFFCLWVDWKEDRWVLAFLAGFMIVSGALFAWTHRARMASDTVRFLTLGVDMGTPTVLLGFGGEWSAVVLFLYTWVAVGHGFRYGLRYLYVAWIVSLGAFCLVYAISAAVNGFWYAHPLLWLGAFLWVAAPTFYVAQLLKQKLIAVRAAEEARAQVERAQADAERERVERARMEAERAAAEAKAASEAKSEFLATMSHEIRTPLNGVLGSAELLARTDLPQRERQLVDWLLTSSRQLRSLIDNLLDLRKIEAGKMTIEHSPFDLHLLMNRLAAMFEPEAKRAHLRFTKCISPEAPYLLDGDSARVQQVLINLAGNALKFTRQGFVRVSVSAPAQTEQEVTLRFEVRDTGIGISPENAGQIFDRFTQADDSIHRQYGGSGLGTTICKHLVELMGGTIGFDSLPGQGTAFWFTVPLSRPPAEAYEDGVAVSIRGARVHFVSDRLGDTAWLARTAQQRQLQLWSFRSVQDALKSSREEGNPEPCLLLVDGEDARIAWREVPDTLRRNGMPLPCVLLHSEVGETDAFDAGYTSLLRSRDPALLLRAVRSVVAGSSSVEEIADFSGQELSGRGGLRVLVAEDNEISRRIIAMMLQAGGHVVTLVGDGDGVLESYRDGAFDVVILDMHMPGRTGLEVARAIRTLEAVSRGRRMPIIMLTAAASTDLREDSLEAGVDLFLSKPVDPRALLRGVAQVFSDPDRAGDEVSANLNAREGCIDRVLLKDMADLARDPAFIQTLTHKFSVEAQRLLDLIEAAVTGGDRPRFRELTHALKGTAMMAGAILLRDSVSRAETIADSDFNRVGTELVGEMRAALEATNQELSRIVA
jgi:two-component system, sensor histidine kinase RpfC